MKNIDETNFLLMCYRGRCKKKGVVFYIDTCVNAFGKLLYLDFQYRLHVLLDKLIVNEDLY